MMHYKTLTNIEKKSYCFQIYMRLFKVYGRYRQFDMYPLSFSPKLN